MSAAERALLEYVTKVTEAAYRTTAEDVQVLRDHGWTEPQIAEAVYITAMFAFFNRVADALGVGREKALRVPVNRELGFDGLTVLHQPANHDSPPRQNHGGGKNRDAGAGSHQGQQGRGCVARTGA